MMRRAGVAVLVMSACGCYGYTRITPVDLPRGDIVALLPDPETKAVGHAVVSSPVGGSIELTQERAGTRVVSGQPPGGRFTLSEADVQRLFGEALAARPPAPRRFLLYFESGANQLTPASERLFADLLAFVSGRSVPDLTAAGHTDTVGNAQANVELGLSRAAMIRDRLVAAGLDASLVSVASHGEADPLVRTPDETPEARNRRVEVSVR